MRVDLLNNRKNVYASTDKVNAEGFPTFERSLEEAYVQVLLTNTLTNTFYTDAKKLLDSSLALHREMVARDPDFAAKAIVFARNEGFMRLQPIVGLCHLPSGLMKKVFNQVIRTPGDLSDFITVMRGGMVDGRKGLGRAAKTAIKAWLNDLSEYHAYRS